MSNSQFKIISRNQPDAKNLVIVVNKSGQVSTDTELLQNLLTSEEDIGTGISILRETSPTPSINEEVMELEKSHLNESFDEDGDESMERSTSKIAGIFPHATLRMETYISSSEARKFANDVLHLGGTDPQSLLLPIDFDFRRKVVQNDHCYTNLMFLGDKKKQAPTMLVKKSATTSKILNIQSKASSQSKNTSGGRERLQQSESEESGNDEEKQDDEQSEEEISYSESDDEDDMDFNVNYRFGKKGKRKRKYRKHKQRQSTFKDFLETGEIALPDDDTKRKYGKKPKKSIVSPTKTPGNTKLSQESSSSTLKNIRPLIKKAPVQSSSKDLSTLSFSILEKSELDANFGMPKIKTEIIENPVQMLPTKTVQAQEKEIVDSIAKDLETSFPVKIENSKEKITNSIDLNALKDLDSTDEEIGDAIIAVLGENVLDELLNQSELINFDASQAQQTSDMIPVALNDSSSIPVTPENEQVSKLETRKIQRNGGRVIILPPIEKPATRGSKRKSVSESPTANVSPTVATPPTALKMIKVEKLPIAKDSSDSRNSSRRSSLNKSESGRSRLSTGCAADEETDDLVSDVSGASEDDPDRLWCICKQPHNNRFMICCDKCEEWYHGKCVNVSKAMGKVIEQGNKKWFCPTCKNGGSPIVPSDKKPMNQLKLTKFFTKNSPKSESSSMCVVCKKKPTRESSIFCSDECIQNHATSCDEKKDESSGKDKSFLLSKSFEKEHHNFVKKTENKNPHDLFSNPVKIQTNSNNVKTTTESKHILVVKSTPVKTFQRQSSSGQIIKSHEKVRDDKPTYSKTSNEKLKAEQERKNVRSIFASTLKSRMNDFNHPEIPKMSNEEIDALAEKIENEMFIYFNRDTRDKYKAKYRSLKFNLGDVKNPTLLEKICSNKISPKQLVQLSSAEMASEDLAKWREYENKHQLEIITKSELESLAQTKVVLKSHKGEEIIESKSETSDMVIQDVELVISKTVLKMEDNELNVSSANNSMSIDHDKSRSRKRSKSRDRHHKSSHSKHRRSRSKSRNHKSSKSHDKSKRSSDHKHKRSRSKSRDKSNHHKTSDKHESKHHKTEKASETKLSDIIPEKQDVDLVGKILDSMGVHVNLDRKKPFEEETKVLDPSPVKQVPSPEPIIEQPKMDVQLFKGHLTVPDVNSFDITAMKISGNLEDMKDHSLNLDMIGRIEPPMVWGYIERVIKSPGKEVCVLKFASNDETAYQRTFQHLLTRQRYGVIKIQSPTVIKDFYIIPLDKESSLPSFLHSHVGSSFLEDSERPDLLIGIAIKVLQENRIKKSATVSYRKKSEKPQSRPVQSSSTINMEINEMRVKTKPSSILTMGLPEIHSAPLNESQDEPYEPYDEDIPASTNNQLKEEDLETEMELINKQIEERSKEIQSLAQNKLLDLNEEEAKRIYENIVVPDNLTEILSKFASADATSSMKSQMSTNVDEEYIPELPAYTPSSSYSHSKPPIVNEMMDIDERVFQQPRYEPQSESSGGSRLRGMTASELLQLVPDDENI